MSKPHHIPVYILCGGKSTRMQTEKGLVCFDNKPFIQHIIDAVKPITNNIVLVTKNTGYKTFGYKLIEDIYADKGPVGGIYTALKHSQSTNNLILSCDIPFITTQILEKIIEKHESEVTFLSDNKKNYPLIGIYQRHLEKLFEEAILNNELKLQQVLQKTISQNILIDTRYQSSLKD